MRLPAVTVDAYNAELRDADGFVGDRASSGAFHSILQDWRERLRAVGDDPLADARLGDAVGAAIGRGKLDRLLSDGEIEAAGLVHTAVEEFAGELAMVSHRLLHLPPWRNVTTIVVGGGFRASRVGEIAIGRALVLLKAGGRSIQLRPIRHHPDEAGLIGCAHLAPAATLADHDSMLGVDIGGSSIRVGIVELTGATEGGLAAARILTAEQWQHRDDHPTREDAVQRLCAMLIRLRCAAGRAGRRLAPFIGIGCPGLIAADGSIRRGGQNLPGDWEASGFNLPQRIRAAMPDIGGRETTVLMHNDAVVQGLSETPWMRDVAHWGVLTIGTGLGNACFSTRMPRPTNDCR